MYLHSDSERERAVVNLQGTLYLSRIESNSYHQEFDMIARYDAVKNYAPLKFTTSVSGWILIWENSQELHVFTVFLTSARYNDLIPTT